MTIKITNHDTRGADNSYGYIYFTRHKSEFRVGWTKTHGVFDTRETPDLTKAEARQLISYAVNHKLIEAASL